VASEPLASLVVLAKGSGVPAASTPDRLVLWVAAYTGLLP